MTESIWVQLITTAGVLGVAIVQGLMTRRLKAIGADAAEARNQTKNTHQTNLRDDLDEAITKATDAATKAGQAASSAARSVLRVEGYVRDVDISVRAVEHSLTRHVGLINNRLVETEQAIPATVRAAMAEHIANHHKKGRP